MAAVAFGRRRYVVRVLAARQHTVVAARTRPESLQVIERDTYPGIGLMTVFADIGRRKMIRRFSGCGCAVVAAHAVGRNSRVIEAHHGRKRDGKVTALTLVSCRRMIDGLADCRVVVVTAGALAVSFIVIHAFQRNETARCMAGIAALRGRNMARRFRSCGYDSALRMTVFAFSQRACKIPATMTITAVARYVRAVKPEAR